MPPGWDRLGGSNQGYPRFRHNWTREAPSFTNTRSWLIPNSSSKGGLTGFVHQTGPVGTPQDTMNSASESLLRNSCQLALFSSKVRDGWSPSNAKDRGPEYLSGN